MQCSSRESFLQLKGLSEDGVLITTAAVDDLASAGAALHLVTVGAAHSTLRLPVLRPFAPRLPVPCLPAPCSSSLVPCPLPLPHSLVLCPRAPRSNLHLPLLCPPLLQRSSSSSCPPRLHRYRFSGFQWFGWFLTMTGLGGSRSLVEYTGSSPNRGVTVTMVLAGLVTGR